MKKNKDRQVRVSAEAYKTLNKIKCLQDFETMKQTIDFVANNAFLTCKQELNNDNK